MPATIPNEWLVNPPVNLVVGHGPYAAAVALILGASRLSFDPLLSGPAADDHGRFPRVFGDLSRILLVVPDTMSAEEALCAHEAAWAWVVKLAPEADQHELAFLFMLPPDATDGFESALAAGLGLEGFGTGAVGYWAWRRSGALDDLIHVLTTLAPADLLVLKTRRSADRKHFAIKSLQQKLKSGEAAAIAQAAEAVIESFRDMEYQLDVFCAPPSHQNGNLFRGWLQRVVSPNSTPTGWHQEIAQVRSWLDRK